MFCSKQSRLSQNMFIFCISISSVSESMIIMMCPYVALQLIYGIDCVNQIQGII